MIAGFFSLILSVIRRVDRRIARVLRHETVSISPGWERGLRAPVSSSTIIRRDYESYSENVEDPVRPEFILRHSFKDRAIFQLQNVYFDPVKGHLSQDGMVILESTPWGNQADFGLKVPVRSKRLFTEDPALPISQRRWNYYHFLIEDFPLCLRLAAQGLEFTPVLPSDAPAYVVEALACLNKSPVFISSPRLISETLLPSRGEDTGWPHKQDVRLLRDFFPAPQKGSSGSAVYISRRNSARTLVGEEEVESFLAQRGFQIVCLENFTFVQQRELFAESRLVVAPHGAGLANLIFAPEGAKVLEIARESNSNPCFELLAKECGQTYSRFMLPKEVEGAFSSWQEDFEKALQWGNDNNLF